MLDVSLVDGFDWDEGNRAERWARHQVSPFECEEIFFNRPLVVADSVKQLLVEKRYYSLCQTNAWRLLFVVFTMRGSKIRVISARDMSKKEKQAYAEADTEVSE